MMLRIAHPGPGHGLFTLRNCHHCMRALLSPLLRTVDNTETK